jgi:EmrB/QacA subfamily drug resistance transporter
VSHSQQWVDPGTRRAAIVVATLGSFLMPFTASAVNIALPAIGRDFPVTAVTLGWVLTSALLSAAALVVPLGRLADLRGRRRVFLAGVVVFTLASLAAALAQSVGQLIAARAVQGMGAAAVFGTGVAIITSVLPPGERGRALGFNVAAVYLGLSIGPFVGGWLTSAFGWRSVFVANVPLGVLMAALVMWWLRGEWAGARGERYDVFGAFLYVITQVALLGGLTRLPSASGVWLASAGLLGLVAFVWWELRTPSPILEMHLLRRNTVFAMSSLAALINYAATSAVGFLLSLYLQYLRGLNPATAGLVLLAQPVAMTLLSPFAGGLSDRVEPRVLASVGMGLCAAGLAALTALGAETPIPYVVGCLVLLGVGFGLFSSPNTNAVMGTVDQRQYGVAAGFLGAMRLTGQVLAMGVAMLIFAVYLGPTVVKSAPPELLVKGTRTAFGLFALLCAVGVFPSLARGKVQRPSKP